jgi:hypothetical protein
VDGLHGRHHEGDIDEVGPEVIAAERAFLVGG